MEQYLVLARKYRPNKFSDLKGQDHLVRTFQNSIKFGRIAHAFLLTGIRGVGKTTSARIIAKALNCLGIDNKEVSPQIEPCGKCRNCITITEDRHPDVFEMDAASNTSVDDVRKIIEELQYRPVSARYKVIIIDEVHMLSNSAFNALLKTLEEPPKHVIFIFATTEIRKIPITIISRCQRFDLRRLTEKEICEHLTNISKKENINLSEEAAKIIAKYSEGSVRDSLSLFDQAINIAGNAEITRELACDMIGIADINKVIDLFEKIFGGDIIDSLDLLRSLYYNGNDPLQIINDLLHIIHEISVIKISPDHEHNIEKNIRLVELAKQISLSVTDRLWQIIVKSIGEIKMSAYPIASAEMLIIRLVYSMNIPSIEELLNGKDEQNISKNNQTNIESTLISEKNQNFSLENFEELLELCKKEDNLILHYHLYKDTYCAKFEDGYICLNFKERAPKDLDKILAEFLFNITNKTWKIEKTEIEGESVSANIEKLFEEKKIEANSDPVINSIMSYFPGSEILNIS